MGLPKIYRSGLLVLVRRLNTRVKISALITCGGGLIGEGGTQFTALFGKIQHVQEIIQE